jgi:hypothetical protein
MKLIRKIPLGYLAPIAIVLAILPPGQPHLIQKIEMLVNGTLVRVIDWLDLLMHGGPLILLLIRLAAEIPVLVEKSSKKRETVKKRNG